MAGKAFTIPTIFTAVNRMGPTIRSMQGQLGAFAVRAETHLSRLERGWRALETPMRSVMKMLRYFGYFFGGAAIVLGLSSVIKTIGDFQQANAGLNAVVTDETPATMRLLSEEARRLGLTTARSATQVVGLQTELAKLGYGGTEIMKMTRSIVQGSIAMDAELARTAELGGAMVRTFTKFTAGDMPRIMDQMTLATLDTALSFEKLETMLPIVSGAANAVNIDFTRLLALLGKLSDAGIDASSSATALRNIFIDSRRRGHSYDQVLENISKRADMLTPAFNKFGKRGAVSAVVLANKLKDVVAEERRLIAATGTADRVAAKRLDTLYGSWTLLKAAWSGFVLTLDDGTGKFSGLLRLVVDTARGIVLLAAGTKEAKDTFKALSPQVQETATQTLKWLKIGYKLVKWLIIFKVVLVAARIAMTTYSIWLGVVGALSGVVAVSVGANTVALAAYNVTTWLAVAATKAWALSMAFLKVGVATLGAGLILLLPIIDSFYRNWEKIEKVFQKGGMLNGLKAIAATINDGILYPIQKLYELLSNLPIVGEAAGDYAKFIQKVRDSNERWGYGTAMDATASATQDRYKYLPPERRESYMRYMQADSARQMEPLMQMLRDREMQKFNGSLQLDYVGPDMFQPRSTSDSVKVGRTMGFGPRK